VRALILFVLSVGLVDSANPSTVGPALFLATQKRPKRQIAGFVVGVFVVLFAGGLILTLGPGRLLIRALPHPGAHTVHVFEVVAGAALFAAAIALFLLRDRVARRLRRREHRRAAPALLLGAGIMAVELPTAFPYFAVIVAIVESGRDVVTQLALLVLFDVVFVAPLLAILLVVQLAGDHGERVLQRIHDRLHRHAAVLIPAGVLLVALVLLALGGTGLARG
jgi:cytochrome c biogenesis protein CcdA